MEERKANLALRNTRKQHIEGFFASVTTTKEPDTLVGAPKEEVEKKSSR